MHFYRPTSLTIHLDRLVENFKVLKSLAPQAQFVCPMIKANAYGHGDLAVAKALEAHGCERVGVSSVEEGIHLRENHIACDIIVFGFHGRSAAEAIVANNLIPLVSDFDQFSWLCQATTKKANIHIKFDTGMHRLGFQLKDVAGVARVLEKNPQLIVEGVGTHLYAGSDIEQQGSGAWLQLRQFEQMVTALNEPPLYTHVYNAAAITAIYHGSRLFKHGFRPGLLVYGVDPEPNLSLKPLVSPVMEFKSKIVSLQPVKSGEVVSYGGTWVAKQDSTIAIVPAGYADGVCRSLSNKGKFLVAGEEAPIRGRVCMDYTMIDVSKSPLPTEKLVGADVTIIGEQNGRELTVEEVSQDADRVTYEVMTGIGERVPRQYGEMS